MGQRLLCTFILLFGIAIASSSAFPLTDLSCFTLNLRELLKTPVDDSARHDRLWEWLRRPETNGAKIIELISHDPKIKKLLGKETGADEGADTIVYGR